MNMVISFIHLIGCIGWSIWWLIIVTPNMFTTSHGPDLVDVLVSIALLLTTTSGIYLVAARRISLLSILQKLRVENSILEKQIEQAKLREQLETTEKTGRD